MEVWQGLFEIVLIDGYVLFGEQFVFGVVGGGGDVYVYYCFVIFVGIEKILGEFGCFVEVQWQYFGGQWVEVVGVVGFFGIEQLVDFLQCLVGIYVVWFVEYQDVVDGVVDMFYLGYVQFLVLLLLWWWLFLVIVCLISVDSLVLWWMFLLQWKCSCGMLCSFIDLFSSMCRQLVVLLRIFMFRVILLVLFWFMMVMNILVCVMLWLILILVMVIRFRCGFLILCWIS